MILLHIVYDIYLPYANSLKDKRHIVKSIKDRLRARLNISVAEVGFQDVWQRCQLAIAWVGIDNISKNKVSMEIDKIVAERDGLVITNVQIFEY